MLMDRAGMGEKNVRSLALFVFNSVLLGFGLAMDAFSVSVANGLNAPRMTPGMRLMIPGTFAAFQFLMPMIGWFCVSAVAETFVAFQRWIPWIALGLLGLIGGKMILESLNGSGESQEDVTLGVGTLLMQGVATSIDALSVGFTISEYNLAAAATAALIIAAVTFVLCVIGVAIGKKAGTALSWQASVLGGCILIAIGVNIFLRGVL